MRLPVNHRPSLAACLAGGFALGAIGVGASAVIARDRPPVNAPANGPAADYPVVVGAPFTIGATVWTPADQLNYDAVGLAASGEADLAGVSAAHKTLPLPSYVEVTALDTGRTILLRLEKRGPMVNDTLIALSPDAAAQLGIAASAKAAVRVRRVNPPEQERAMLRSGGRAPERMETPEGLLKVLRRKLADQSPLLPPPSAPPVMPKAAQGAAAPAPPVKAPSAKAPLVAPASSTPPAPKPAAAPPPKAPATVARKPAAGPTAIAPATAPVARGITVVQVGAFSSEANARALAAKLGGQASRAGKFWRVRLGPYESRAKAGPALEKARRAGYTDARIQNAD